MDSANKNVVILGAGPAGMTCAFELSKQKIPSTIIDKDSTVGGLAKTLIFKEKNLLFRTDIGPHRFFSKNRKLYELLEELLGDEWILVKRQTRQYIEGKFYDYPIKATQALSNIGVFRASIMILDYCRSVLQYRVLRKKINNFEDFTVANFGRSLGEFNMLNYTEKIWGIPCSELHADWAKQRIKGLNLTSALKNALFKSSASSPKSLVDQFYYPKYGTGTIYNKMLEHVKDVGSEALLESMPTKILHDNKKITHITIKNKNHTIEYSPKYLVSSIPITDFLNLLSPRPPKSVVNAINSLRWREQVYLFLIVKKNSITKDNWIYFPDKSVPFSRFAEMKNFSKEMSPKGYTSLIIEFYCFENDNIWNLSSKELFDLSMPHLERAGFVTKKQVVKYYSFKRRKVYPVYDLSYIKNLKTIKTYLDKFENLFYIGRPGRFKYNNQDHSLEMGILAAEGIINSFKPDFDAIGSEEEYFEKGEVYKKKK